MVRVPTPVVSDLSGQPTGWRPEPKAPASSLFSYLTASNRPKWVVYSSPITPNTGMPASL